MDLQCIKRRYKEKIIYRNIVERFKNIRNREYYIILEKVICIKKNFQVNFEFVINNSRSKKLVE